MSSITKVEDLKELFEIAQNNKVSITGICHDCKEIEVTVNADWDMETGQVTVEGNGAYYRIVPQNNTVLHFFKCTECFTKDSILRNYMPTEVYSRITGYLRPVAQWNPGKTSEHKMRMNYKVDPNV